MLQVYNILGLMHPFADRPTRFAAILKSRTVT